MDLKLKGKVALVLASSQGLGKAVAASLVREGATVAISSRNADTLMATKIEIGAALAVPVDLSVKGSSFKLVAEVEKALGPVDILITNAGGPPKGSFMETKTEQWVSGFEGLWISCLLYTSDAADE